MASTIHQPRETATELSKSRITVAELSKGSGQTASLFFLIDVSPWFVPVRTFALRTHPRLLIRLSRHPFMGASLAPVSRDGHLNFGHSGGYITGHPGMTLVGQPG